MRIVIFTNNYKPVVGGIAVSIALFRQGLIDAGHEVHIVTPEYQDYEDEEPYVYRVPALDLPGALSGSLALPLKAPITTTIQGIKPAVIHSQQPYLMGDVAAAVAQDMNVPLVWTFHTRYDINAKEYFPFAPELATSIMNRVIERYLEECVQVISPTASIKDFIQRQYAPQVPVSVVPTPIDLSAYCTLEPRRVRATLAPEDNKLLMYVGRLAIEKNLDFLLRAFAPIAAQCPAVRLVFVGEGLAEDNLRQMARKLGLEERITFTGAIPHDEVPHYTAAADMFIFSSLTDTQGLALMEAMAAGTPVVAVEAPGPVDVLAEGGGILVPPQEDAFADAVCTLLTNEDRLHEMGQEAKRAVQRYSIPEATQRLLAVYEAALTRHSQATSDENDRGP
jgi:1,2-diacylglycerol 3-alpha-glucosyltransferase